VARRASGMLAAFSHKCGIEVSIALSKELLAKLEVDEQQFGDLLTKVAQVLSMYMLVTIAARGLALRALNLLLANITTHGNSIIDLAKAAEGRGTSQ